MPMSCSSAPRVAVMVCCFKGVTSPFILRSVMELVYHIQGFLAIDWKNIVAKVRTLWYNGEAKGDFRAVRAKIIDIWRKSVHDLGGEKGLERGIFAEYFKNFVRFLPAFAETTHPREGTETCTAENNSHPPFGNNSSPRGDGNDVVVAPVFPMLRKQLIPARGRKQRRC